MLSRSFRTLIFPAAVRLLPIKDLKDLSFFRRRFSIDMQVLKDLKRCFYLSHSLGGAPQTKDCHFPSPLIVKIV